MAPISLLVAFLLQICSSLANTVAYHCVLDSSEFTSVESLKSISGCRSLRGDLKITNFTDSTISLDNLEFIEGSLSIANSSHLQNFSAPKLHTITRTFELSRLAGLTAVSIPSLRNLCSLSLKVAPSLSEVEWKNLKAVENITIVDTSFKTLVGSFSAPQVQFFDVSNNRYLEFVAFNFDQVTHSFQLTGNAINLEASFSDLTKAKNITIGDVTNLNMDKLSVVTGTLNLQRNRFSHISFPSLVSIGESFQLSENTRLTSADFSSVSMIGGGLVISNNSILHSVDCFSSLEVIGGALEVHGSFKSTKWKSLNLVKGSIKLFSNQREFDCSNPQTGRLRDTLNGGKFVCTHINIMGKLEHAKDFSVSGTIRHNVVCGVILLACFAASLLV